MGRLSAERYDDTRLIKETARLVRKAQRLEPRYANGSCAATTMEMAELLRRSTCRVYRLKSRPRAKALTIPPIAGEYAIGIRADLSWSEYAFALRHELAHVLAGDVDEPVRMVNRGYLTQAERYADLFALADLVPRAYLDGLRRLRIPWGEIRADIEQQIRELWGPDWPWARVADRSVLRLRLYREHGI